MNNTYQLSQSGIERLERFKRDIEAGDFEMREGAYYSDGSVMYYEIHNKEFSTACCFDCNYNDAVNIALEQIKNTLSSKTKKMLHDDGQVFYCPVLDGVGLNRSDITTPAQRALEALGKKLQDRSKVYE